MPIPVQTPVALIIFGLAGSFQVGYHSSVYNQPQSVMEQFVASSYLAQYGEIASADYVTVIWSLIVSCYAIGSVFSDFFCQYLMDKLGRKGTLYLTASLGVMGSGLQALAYVFDRYQLLIIGRLFVGMGASAGACTQVVFFSEIAPTKIRGTAGAREPKVHKYVLSFLLIYDSNFSIWSTEHVKSGSWPKLLLIESFVYIPFPPSIIHVMAVTATILANILGFKFALGTSTLWPYLHVVAIGISLVFFVTAWRFWESPKSLAVNKCQDDLALKSLTFYNGSDADIDGLLSTIHAEAKENDFSTSKLRVLNLVGFLRGNKNFRTLSIFFLVISVAIPFCGYFLMLTYAVYILQKAGLSVQAAHYAALSYCFVNLFAACIGLWVIEKHGRRKMTLAGSWTTLICLSVIFICQAVRESSVQYSATVLSVFSIGAVLFHASGKASLVCANDALKGELFPSFIRATTVIYAGNLWLNVVNVFMSFAYLPIERKIGSWALLILLIIPMVVISVVLTKLCPETKGKHVSSIVQEIRGMEPDAREDIKLVE